MTKHQSKNPCPNCGGRSWYCCDIDYNSNLAEESVGAIPIIDLKPEHHYSVGYSVDECINCGIFVS